MSKIKSIKAREVLDSRAQWTVEVDLVTDKGLFRDSAPSGASKGKYEAKTVDVSAAVKNINKIAAPRLKSKNVLNQKEIDEILKELNIGANATTPISMAVCRAAAATQNLPLWKYISTIFSTAVRNVISMPRPAFNVINGGVHAENDLDFQEFMIVPAFAKASAFGRRSGLRPTKSAGKPQFKESLKIASEIYQKLRKKLGKNVGDEGGFAPPFQIPEQALELIKDNDIIIDAAASQFYVDGKYKTKRGIFTREGLLRYYQNLIKKYSIIGLEDPFAETDLESWKKISNLKSCVGTVGQISNLLIIGDDLLVTNPERIKMAKEKNLCNGLLLKINQIGTVTEALEAARLAKSYGWKIMVSHRSGETNDDFIADFAVGIGADYIKAGAPARGERVAKYNRLLRIEEELTHEKDSFYCY